MGMVTLGGVGGARLACPDQGGEIHPVGVVVLLILSPGREPPTSPVPVTLQEEGPSLVTLRGDMLNIICTDDIYRYQSMR